MINGLGVGGGIWSVLEDAEGEFAGVGEASPPLVAAQPASATIVSNADAAATVTRRRVRTTAFFSHPSCIPEA